MRYDARELRTPLIFFQWLRNSGSSYIILPTSQPYFTKLSINIHSNLFLFRYRRLNRRPVDILDHFINFILTIEMHIYMYPKGE